MTDIEKIYKVLSIKKIRPSKAEKTLNFSQGTLTGSMRRLKSRKGNGGVQDDTKETFMRVFHVKQEWWESPEGDNFENNGTHDRENMTNWGTVFREVPFYGPIAIAGFDIIGTTDPVTKPVHMINPGTMFRNAEGALQITGHSMFPKYPSGSIIFYRSGSKERILWGEDYVVELLEDRRLVLKRIEKSEIKENIKLCSYNVNKDNKYVYDPIDYPLAGIGRIFMVLGMMQLEAMQT